MRAADLPPSPYVGPRSYRKGEALYGRDREARDLFDLLVAERIVLLYSTSGAGKTSLINAQLLPLLAKEGFSALPVIRMAHPPPHVAERPSSFNRYAMSAVYSLESGSGLDRPLPANELASFALPTYVSQRSWIRDDHSPKLLIFDQFEEILTTEQEDTEGKRDFFQQLGQMLEDRNLWALFSMREEYLAGLDPYLSFVPTRLASRYRLELLSREAALQAVVRPADDAGVTFEESAGAKLVDGLRESPHTGRTSGAPGHLPYIEPLHLQVVCLRLWEKPRPVPRRIRAEDVEPTNDVDSALANHYAECVEKVARGTGAKERLIRFWFELKLITDRGVRAPIVKGPETSEGLPNCVIQALVAERLVREESRHGTTFFELTHDRMIGPIITDNAHWMLRHADDLQKRAREWTTRGRPDRLLLSGVDLGKAENWAEEHRGELLEMEHHLLDASRSAEKRRRDEERRDRRIKLAAIGAIFALIALSAVSSYYAYKDRTRRDELASKNAELEVRLDQLKEARGSLQVAEFELSAAEVGTREAVAAKHITRAGWLVAEHAFHRARELLAGLDVKGFPARYMHSRDLLRWFAHHMGGLPEPELFEAEVPRGSPQRVALSSNEQWLAVAGSRGSIRVFNAHTGVLRKTLAGRSGSNVRALAFHPKDERLLSAGDDRRIVVWSCPGWSCTKPKRSPVKSPGAVWALAIDPSGTRVASGGTDCAKRADRSTEEGGRTCYTTLWGLQADGKLYDPRRGYVQDSTVGALAFSPDGSLLAVAAADGGKVTLWHVPPRDGGIVTDGFGSTGLETETEPAVIVTHGRTVSSIQFDTAPGAARFATGSTDGDIEIWRVPRWTNGVPESVGRPLRFRNDSTSLAFLPRNRLASADRHRGIRIWDIESEVLLRVLDGHEGGTTDLAATHNGLLYSVGADGKTHRWDPSQHPGLQIIDVDAVSLAYCAGKLGCEAFATERREAVSLALSPDGATLALGFKEGDLQIHALPGGSVDKYLPEAHGAWIRRIMFSNDGRWLATAGHDNEVEVRDVEDDYEVRYRVEHQGPVSSVDFSPDSGLLATGSYDDRIGILRLDDGTVRYFPESPTGDDVNSVSFSPSGKWLVSTTNRGPSLWRVSNRELQATGRTFDEAVSMVTWASVTDDGNVVQVGLNGKRRLFADGQNTKGVPLPGHTHHVYRSAFGPRGRVVASVSRDNTVRVWDLERNEDLLTLGLPVRSHERKLWDFEFRCSSSGRDCWIAVPLPSENRVALFDLGDALAAPP